MRRLVVPGVMLGVIGVALFVAGTGSAQPPADKTIRMDTLNVRDTLYHLTDGGGNTMALIDELSPDGGVVLVDTKLPGWGPSVIDIVGQVTDLPVTTIINTHAHLDHAGSNPEFATVRQIIAHENTRANMARMELYTSNQAGLPTTTFTDRFSLLDGLDRIELYHFGPGHTDGDTVVVFPVKGVAYLGGLFPSKSTPVIDTDNGGSGLAFPETLARVVDGIEGITRVITGHGPFPTTYAGRGRREQGADRAWTGWMTWKDLAEYADFNRDFLAAVEAAFTSGQTVDEAAETLVLPNRYADYGMQHARTNIETIYRELAAR